MSDRRAVIKTGEAVRTARAFLGTSYEALDCIGLITMVIRKAAGGIPRYRVAHTNALWDSIDQADKYRDTVWRQRGIRGARAGMLCWKIEDRRDGTVDARHVGLVTDAGTVIHSSSVKGRVIEELLDEANGWNGLSEHRNIELGEEIGLSAAGKEDIAVIYKARVATKEGGDAGMLRLRQKPSASARVIAYLPKGTVTEVLKEKGDWLCVRFAGMVGYAWRELMERMDEAPESGLHTGRYYTVTVPHVDAQTAAEILEAYPIAEAEEEEGGID